MTAVLIITIALGIIAIFLKGDGNRSARRNILIIGALVHNIGSISLLFAPNFLAFPPYFHVDDIGRLFIILTSCIFTLIAFYSLGYFPTRRLNETAEAGGHIYVSCMLFFLASITLAICTLQIGVLWIAIEATTLASAPLIYYRRNARSLEAAWKYLLICSVGIAIALLGIFFVATASKGIDTDLSLNSLIANGARLDKQFLRMGFILIMVGFGTKMGLAPMHNWLPDAHSEAPSPVSALLSATLLNCALLGIIRFYQICVSAGLAGFASRLMVIFGLVSLFTAAIFMTSQKDYKRLFAYSSIEHMGIIVLGIGVGAHFASMLHIVAHSLTKALLFLTAGNVLVLYRTKLSSEISGLLRTSPPTGALLTIGGLAIMGSPPFLPFISEFLILRHGLGSGHWPEMLFYLLFLGIIFVSMSKIIFKMIHGKQRELIWGELPKLMVVPPALLAFAIISFGLYMPDSLAQLIDAAGRILL